MSNARNLNSIANVLTSLRAHPMFTPTILVHFKDSNGLLQTARIFDCDWMYTSEGIDIVGRDHMDERYRIHIDQAFMPYILRTSDQKESYMQPYVRFSVTDIYFSISLTF